MTVHSLVRNRALTLAVVLLAASAVGIPMMGMAQDVSPATETDPMLERGSEIFNTVCIACHQPDGKGIKGIYLPLAGNPLVTLDDPTYLITTILNGRGGMPRFDTAYSDQDIAAIATFVRQEWGNEGGPVTAEQVAEVHASFVAPAVNTPEGQIPEGSGRATPVIPASPEASPEATPAR